MEKERILIFGWWSQIGGFYLNYFLRNSAISTVDITDTDAVKDVINHFRPTVVINAAAKTDSEWCSQNKPKAFMVNAWGADNIAEICDKRGIYFIHLSTGCIFQSENEQDAKREDDMPDPAIYYTWTKFRAEQLIQSNKSEEFKYLILRLRQPISSEVSRKNMLIKMLTFRKFINVPNSCTVLEDLMDWTSRLIQIKQTGILHATNSGFTTPYKIGRLLQKHILPDLPVEKISEKELNASMPNERVAVVLDVNKLQNLGIKVAPLAERIEPIIIRLGRNIREADKELVREELEMAAAQVGERTITNNYWQSLCA